MANARHDLASKCRDAARLGEDLQPTTKGARVRFSGKNRTVIVRRDKGADRPVVGYGERKGAPEPSPFGSTLPLFNP
jgi:hypothetical protein